MKNERRKRWPDRSITIKFTFVALGLVLGVTGCQSFGFFNDANPQINDRVLAADTRQPLVGVLIVRGAPGQFQPVDGQQKGAQRLLEGRPVMTGADGDFAFPGSRSIAFFRRAGGRTLTLSFQAAHYAPFQTNFTAAQVSGPAVAENPQIEAGDILLRPLDR